MGSLIFSIDLSIRNLSMQPSFQSIQYSSPSYLQFSTIPYQSLHLLLCCIQDKLLYMILFVHLLYGVYTRSLPPLQHANWAGLNSSSTHSYLPHHRTCLRNENKTCIPCLFHQVKMQCMHFRFHAHYFLLPWKIPQEISRRSLLFHN